MRNQGRKRAMSDPMMKKRAREWSETLIRRRATEWTKIDMKILQLEKRWAKDREMLQEFQRKCAQERELALKQKDAIIDSLETKLETMKDRHREVCKLWSDGDLIKKSLINEVGQKNNEIRLLKERVEQEEREPRRKIRKLHAYAFADAISEN